MLNKNIKPLPPLQVIQEFPFLDESFDAVTDWEVMQKLGEKTNEIIKFINTILEEKISEYINSKFNQMMINSMYEPETETLILYLDDGSDS
jgi:hypothetical protein